jgi:hypothetical protein
MVEGGLLLRRRFRPQRARRLHDRRALSAAFKAVREIAAPVCRRDSGPARRDVTPRPTAGPRAPGEAFVAGDVLAALRREVDDFETHEVA